MPQFHLWMDTNLPVHQKFRLKDTLFLIGIIGAVMGLIQVMGNLSDPSKLGSGIAVAFVATIYGVGAANLLFIPIANKLKNIVHTQSQFREMVVEGMVSIAEGENPRNIETKLFGFLR